MRGFAALLVIGTALAGAVASAQIPVSAEFENRSPDPRGGDAGFNTFKRIADGRGIAFAGFSHNHAGVNSVSVYNPVADSWQIVVPHTPWPPGFDVTGLSFLGNRDDHATFVIGNDYWALDGERGITLFGNWRGVLNTQTWQWSIDDDPATFTPTGSALGNWNNAAADWVPALDMGYLFAGLKAGAVNDGLVRIERNPPGSVPPFRVVEYPRRESELPAFEGAERLIYVSNQHWVRGAVVHIYGGQQQVRYSWPDTRVFSRNLWELKFTDPPRLSVISVNNLPDGLRVEGPALLAYRDPVRDLAVITNGKLVNVYDYATGTWASVPVLTPPDVYRESPTPNGAGRAGFYSPEAGKYIILGGNTRTYSLKLNFTGGPTVPGQPLAAAATAGNASAVVSFSPPSSNGGSAITSYTVLPNPAGGTDQQAGTTATTRNITGLANGTAYTFTVRATNAIGTGPPSAPTAPVTPSSPATVPAAPQNLVASAGNANAVVSFAAPASNGGSPITLYTIVSNPPGGVDQQAGTTATTRNISGLANGTTYTFTATATNAIGTGAPSAASNPVTPIAPTTVPGAPTAVAAVAGNGTASVTFTPPAASGGSPILGYRVTSNPGGGVDVQAGTLLTMHTVSNLQNGVAYTFTVTASNALGTGAPSAPSSPVTPQSTGICAGFADVSDASSACPSIEWLRNRAITQGCAAGAFCPDEPVTRLALAALAERLGRAVSPVLLFVESAPGTIDPSLQPVICTTTTVPAARYPRAARVRFALSAGASVPSLLGGLAVASTDGGATWSAPAAVASVVEMRPAEVHRLAGEALVPLAPDTPYRFGARVFPVVGTPTLSASRCQTVVEVLPQNGAHEPFDPAPARSVDGDRKP